jgi:hypothetical protein
MFSTITGFDFCLMFCALSSRLGDIENLAFLKFIALPGNECRRLHDDSQCYLDLRLALGFSLHHLPDRQISFALFSEDSLY